MLFYQLNLLSLDSVLRIKFPYVAGIYNHGKVAKEVLNLGTNWLKRPAALLKRTLAKVFSCEFCKILKNTFFTEHLRTTASGHLFCLKGLIHFMPLISIPRVLWCFQGLWKEPSDIKRVEKRFWLIKLQSCQHIERKQSIDLLLKSISCFIYDDSFGV